VTRLGRESGSMTNATATFGAALIAATIAVLPLVLNIHRKLV
jgi:hypothetical protein